MGNVAVHLAGTNWARVGADTVTAIKGAVFIDNRPADASAIFSALANCSERAETLETLLKRCNGHYAWVRYSSTRLVAAVDHIRSWPLFYGQHKGRFFLSDDAEWLRQQVNDHEIDPVARDEFSMAGYVTGDETLYPRVKQLQAGEYLLVNAESSPFEVRRGRHFQLLHREPEGWSESALRESLGETLSKAIGRLIGIANGRQIVVPLSGGFDSRLIATRLKEIGYDNILCFSYGVRGSRESQHAQAVARALNLRWSFVEYSANAWRDAWRTESARSYRRKAGNNSSLPHVQDWLAVRELTDQGAVEPCAVVVPGHTGDFIGGGHIPSRVFHRANHGEVDLLDALVEVHFSNAPTDGLLRQGRSRLHERIRNRISIPFDGSAAGFANSYEYWVWQERQAKYIVNSVRVYEHFDLDWWLPLWDLEFVCFWQGVPLQLRKYRRWFKLWIAREYERIALHPGNEARINAADTWFRSNALIATARRAIPSLIWRRLQRIRRRRIYSSHPLAFEGLVSEGDLRNYVDRGFNLIGIYSDLYLNRRW